MKLSNKRKKKIKKIFSTIIGIILFVLIIINTCLIVKYNILPLKYLLLYSILIVIVPLIFIYLTVFQRPKRFFRKILTILEIIYILILIVLFLYLNKTFNFLNNLSVGSDYETKNYYVLVSSTAGYKKLDNLNNRKIGYSKSVDSSINAALIDLDKKIKINHVEKNSYNDLFTALNNNEIDCILMLDSIYNLLTEDNEELKSNLKILYTFNIKEKIKDIGKDVNVTEESFIVYISGIDSYNKVTDKGRSDVNIVMVVNPNTHKILTINIPRDYYVKLNGIREMDKLTHAGIYGVEVSTKTIEDLLDIDINYYVKVNYNALIKLVDALKGVSVYSEYDFYSAEFRFKFNKGYNYADGKMALDFVRTRKAFPNGDRVRGENQQRMIEAIMQKANSPKILVTYLDILEGLEGTFTTNISTEKITSLVNMQLDTMPNWELTKMSLNGTDGSEITYSVPSIPLYVMYPKEETIEEARNAIMTLMQEK